MSAERTSTAIHTMLPLSCAGNGRKRHDATPPASISTAKHHTPPRGHVPPARLRGRAVCRSRGPCPDLPPRLGALPFVRDTLTTEAAPPLDGAPDIQPPVGFAPQLRGGRERFPLVAAAESHADGAGSGTPSDEPANTAELAKKLQNPVTDLITVPMQHNWDFGIGPADAMRSRNCCLSLALSPLRKGHARFRTMCTCTSSQCRNGSSAVADSYKRKRAQLRVSKMSP